MFLNTNYNSTREATMPNSLEVWLVHTVIGPSRYLLFSSYFVLNIASILKYIWIHTFGVFDNHLSTICVIFLQMASKFRSHVAAHEAGTLHRSLPCVHCDKTFKKQYDLARYLWRRKRVTSYVYIFISDTSSPTLASSPTLVLSVVRALWMEQG